VAEEISKYKLDLVVHKVHAGPVLFYGRELWTVRIANRTGMSRNMFYRDCRIQPFGL
jgi:hypothetical protein